MTNESQLTFLLIDNVLSRLDAAGSFLSEMGFFNYLEAEDGQEAWALINNFKIDFVVCHTDVGDVNGLALLKIIRSHEEYSAIPFILLGDTLTSGLVAKAGRAGVSDIIVLPLSGDVFKFKINDILEFQKEPQNQEAERLYNQGVEMMRAGRYEEALKSFESILSVHENAEVYFNMGYIKSSRGDWEEALKLFRRATQIDNNYARAYKQMSEAYAQIGNSEAAHDSMQKAADIYVERKQDHEAEEALFGVLKIKPDTNNVYNSLGIVYRRQKRYPDAAKMYEKAMKVNPKDEHIHYNLARVYLELKDFVRAKDILDQALQLNPNFSPARELARVAEMSLTISH